jgi:hypothetical protein
VVGPVRLGFETRVTICEALVLPAATEAILGSIPLAGLDVVIDPAGRLIVAESGRPLGRRRTATSGQFFA